LSDPTPQQERLVVLELGALAHRPDLLKAVLFALILQIESGMYDADPERKKLCVIDEAWRLLSGSNATAAQFIEKGFRTARKTPAQLHRQLGNSLSPNFLYTLSFQETTPRQLILWLNLSIKTENH